MDEREARAAERAASIPPGEYHAYNNDVVRWIGNGQTESVVTCESHWDACLVLLALGKSS